MSTMNPSLPDELKAGREQFRQYLLEGVNAKPVGRMDATYFAQLRKILKKTPQRKTQA